MAEQLNPKFKPKQGKVNISLRDINTNQYNSDTVVMLLIFCFLVFIFLCFILLLFMLFLRWIDRSAQKHEISTQLDLGFFRESINFFEEKNQVILSSFEGNSVSFSLSKYSGFDSKDFSSVSRHSFLGTTSVTLQQDKPQTDNFLLQGKQQKTNQVWDSSILDVFDFTAIAKESSALVEPSDRVTTLQEFFPLSLSLTENTISTTVEIFPRWKNLPENSLLHNSDPVLIPNTIHPFSARIAIANQPDLLFSRSPEESPQHIPEPRNGLSPLAIVILIIFFVSRKGQVFKGWRWPR